MYSLLVKALLDSMHLLSKSGWNTYLIVVALQQYLGFSRFLYSYKF